MIFRIIGEKHLWENSTPEGKEAPEFRVIGTSDEALANINVASSYRVIDTETTGLKWMKKDGLFLVALANDSGPVYCINFQDYSTFNPQLWGVFESDWVNTNPDRFKILFKEESVWVGHNIKFDYHMLHKKGFELRGTLKDTMVRERLLDNDKMTYSLANTVKRTFPDLEKSDLVEKFIEENGLYHVEIGAFGKPFKNKYYHMVPFNILVHYAAMDIHVTRELYKNQEARLLVLNDIRDLTKVMELEENITRICCEMEQTGIQIDKEYCQKASDYESDRILKSANKFKELTGMELIDSSKFLSPIFKELGFDPPQTEKANDSISATFLEKIDHDVARTILEHRDAMKRLVTYFNGFLALADKYDSIHADMKQSGTRTGRFSYSEPNLQNIPAQEGCVYPVRASLIPREGFIFVGIDYAQQEFRLMLDYAKEMELIDKIKNGHDPHQATADLTGLTRQAAKTLNFGLLYGMGIQKLADALKITYEEAKEFKHQYFRALPMVKQFIYAATDRAKSRGAVYTWLNRKLDFMNVDFAYKATNALIQGGCADITKTAMVRSREYILENKLKSRMLIQIHDEILFEIAEDEVEHVTALQKIMEEAYVAKHLPLTTSVAYSIESFHDMIEVGDVQEIEEAVRKSVQRKSKRFSGDAAQHMVQ